MVAPEKVEIRVQQLFKKHLLQGWKFAWARGKNTAGTCHHAKRLITLSKPIAELSTMSQVEQTIYHEIAHAIAGHGAGHGPYWLKIAQSIGYQAGQYHEGPTPPPQWLGTCPRGHQVVRHRLTAETQKRSSCAQCSPTYNAAYRYQWLRLPSVSSPQSRRLG